MSATSIEACELSLAIERWQNAPDDLAADEYLAMVREIAARAVEVTGDTQDDQVVRLEARCAALEAALDWYREPKDTDDG